MCYIIIISTKTVSELLAELKKVYVLTSKERGGTKTSPGRIHNPFIYNIDF